MKKKIKDLTLEEVNKIHTNSSFCSTCELMTDKGCILHNYLDCSKKDVNKEIEVEE